MAGLTQAQLEAQLTTWNAALTAVTAKQSYTIGGRPRLRIRSPVAPRCEVSCERRSC